MQQNCHNGVQDRQNSVGVVNFEHLRSKRERFAGSGIIGLSAGAEIGMDVETILFAFLMIAIGAFVIW